MTRLAEHLLPTGRKEAPGLSLAAEPAELLGAVDELWPSLP